MLTIQCTKKLAAELDISLFREMSEHSKPLYCWHSHLFTFHRRKCVLVMNNETRYNFVLFGLVKADFKRYGDLIREHISRNLLDDGMEQYLIDRYLNFCNEVGYMATNNRSILSQMNEMIKIAQFEMQGNMDEFGDPHIEQVNRLLNKFVMLQLPKFSGEMMRDALYIVQQAK